MGEENQYRPDIDGLRALAVGLVILYHLRPAALPSGYLGVDIFFVISGYVVAKSALAKARGRPAHDVAAFWMRRIRRIVPPLLLVVGLGAVCAAAVFPAFPPINYQTIFRTGATALFGLSNLYLNRIATDYFLLDTAQLNPFLHTWSLGVEEQYYVLFALLALALPAVLKLDGARRWFLIGLFAAVTGGSLLWAIASHAPALSKFYLPQSRIWEIGLGSLAAVAGLERAGVRLPPRARTALRFALVLGLIALAFTPHSDRLYPTAAVVVCCLAALGVVCVRPTPGARLEPLQMKAVVYLGLISYGLYLWHWVVLFVLQSTIGSEALTGVVIALAAPVVLASLSYRFVEGPFRDRRRMTDRQVLVVLIPSLAATLGLLVVIHQHPGLMYAGAAQDWDGDWMPPPQHTYISGISKQGCHFTNAAPVTIPSACVARHQPEHPGRTILSLGDSHVFSDWAMLSAAYGQGWDWAAISVDGCPLTRGGPGCVAYWAAAPAYIKTNLGAGDVAYVSVNWAGRAGDEDTETLGRLADAAASVGASLIIKTPLPVMQRPAFLCTREWFRTNYTGCEVSRRDELIRIEKPSAALESLAAARPNIRLFRPFDLLCPDEVCRTFRGGKPLFRDANHLSVWGSKSLAPDFVRFLGDSGRQPASDH